MHLEVGPVSSATTEDPPSESPARSPVPPPGASPGPGIVTPMRRPPIRFFHSPGDHFEAWTDDDEVAVRAELSRPWRHAAGFVIITAASLAFGLLLGADPTPASFAWLYTLAFLSDPFSVGLRARTAIAASFAGAGAAGFLAAGPAYLDRPELGPQVGFLFGTVVLAVLVGQGIQDLRISAALKRRRVEEGRADLAAANAGLDARVREQRAELRALAFHIANVTEAEQRGLRRDVRGDFMPEIGRLGTAVAGLQGNGEPCSADALDECDSAMRRAHLVLRHVLRRLHPNVVQRMGLNDAVAALVDDFQRKHAVSVELSLCSLPSDVQVRTSELIYATIRDGLRRWQATGVAERGSVTLSTSGEGVSLELEARGEFQAEPGVSVVLVGLRERAGVLGGELELSLTPSGTTLQLTVPHAYDEPHPASTVMSTDAISRAEPEGDDGFGAYLVAFASANHVQYGAGLIALLLLWWPFDFLILDDPAILRGVAWFRVICVGVAASALVLPPVRRRCIERPLVVGPLLLCVALAPAGFVIGSVTSLAGGWAHYFTLGPALILPFVQRLRFQLVTSVAVTSSGLLGFFAASPEDLAGPEVQGLIALAVVLLLLHLAMGNLLHRRLRTDWRLGRKRQRQRALLRDRWRELKLLVRGQTSELRERAMALQTARDDARAWMVHEMHDGLGQVVASLGYTVAHVRRSAGLGDHAAAAASAREAEDLVATLKEELARILLRLGPRRVDAGLTPALEDLLRSFAPTGELETRLYVDLGPHPVAPELRLLAYRVVQEGLSNILKHARATRVTVELALEDGGLRIAVTDDGVGLPSDPGEDGLGLPGITRRVTSAGGEVRWSPATGGGTLLSAYLPSSWTSP